MTSCPPKSISAGGKRGQFHHADAALRLSVYLDASVQAWLIAQGNSQGIGLSELANALLRKHIERIDSAG